MPSLSICQGHRGRQAPILYSAAGDLLSFLWRRYEELSPHMLAGPQARLKSERLLYFSRQTSRDNDDFSHRGEIKGRRRWSFEKEHSVKHQKSSTGITLQLVFLTSFRLCQAITNGGGKSTLPEQTCIFLTIKLGALQLVSGVELGSRGKSGLILGTKQ